jgi:hypothetical protein
MREKALRKKEESMRRATHGFVEELGGGTGGMV